MAVLTPPGTDLLSEHVPDVIHSIDEWFTQALTPEQLTALLSALHAVRRHVRPGATAGALRQPRTTTD
ncbi:MAG: hypothetical protein M3Y48_07905 [Actinomycetota bacterium]|nr:hypothetical protein [Actinomycetota bacterium]